MRAISSHAPWAWAIAEGHRQRENRRWRPGFRAGERIAIHASRRTWTEADLDEVERSCGHRPPDELDIGAVVSTAVVTEVVWREDDGGYWSVLLDAVERLPSAVEVRGQLGVWSLSEVVAKAIHAQLATPRPSEVTEI